MTLSYLLLAGYPVFDAARFVDLEAPAEWRFQPALSAQLLFHDDSGGTAVMQFHVRGGPERHGGSPAYIATPLRYALDGGWRLERSVGPVQFRWDFGMGLSVATLHFQPHIWNTWLAWGLDTYTTPSIAIGSPGVRGVLGVQANAFLVPTTLSGQEGLNPVERWRWPLFGTSVVVLAGIEWGSAPAKKERAGQ